MSGSSKRVRRMADLIQREVSLILRQHVVDPRLQQLVITLVEMSPDLKSARVLFTVPEADTVEDVMQALAKASGFMRSQMAKTAELRYVPKLFFQYDAQLMQAEHLSNLIDQVAPAVES